MAQRDLQLPEPEDNRLYSSKPQKQSETSQTKTELRQSLSALRHPSTVNTVGTGWGGLLSLCAHARALPPVLFLKV